MSNKETFIKEAAKRAMTKEAISWKTRAAAKAKRLNRNFRYSTKGTKATDGDEGSNLTKTVGILVAAIGINQFVRNMISYAKEKKIEHDKPKYYKKMIKANPDLMNEDPQEVMDLWNTLYHNSTHLAQDPVAAGAFITQNIQGRVRDELGGPTIDTYSTLNNIESSALRNRDMKTDPGTSLTDTLLTSIGLTS